jgi:hypothetical protein
MRYCENCGLHVTGVADRCPLCQGVLTGEPDGPDRFPALPPRPKAPWFALRLLALGTVAAAAICIAVNISFPSHGGWSLVVLAALLTGWLTVGLAIRKRGNPLKAMIWQVFVVSALVLGWDIGTGFSGWSVDFVMPILAMCSLVAMAVLGRILRRQLLEYLFYMVLNILLGLVLPLVLLLTGTVRVVYPSLACIVVSVIALAALLLFRGKAVQSELSRRMHL